ncbi:MAG TPA: glycosyltransferase family 4 protein [Thermoanaerobaculia bacterium]|nr:glycosyltransferase family 4 protein [Thermoanaerobaculia bacterium]
MLRLRGAGWTVQATSASRGRLRRLADMLLTAWTRRHEYAISQVDVYSGPAFLWALAVTSLLRVIGKPYVLTLHGGRLPRFSRRWPRSVRRVLKSARAVTVPSGYLLREMKPYRADMVLLPNPLDVAAYPFSVRSQPRPRLVWLRAFHETYNPSLAPAVLAVLVARIPEVSLTMIGPDRGDGSLEATLAAAARLGVADRLRVVPGVPKEDVGRALSEADVFLNTTNVDNTPVSVLEAMACGLCVVSTNVGGIADLVDDGRDGILVRPADAAAMADAILRVLGDPSLAARLSGNARRKAELFDWSIVLPKWERVLQSAVLDD